MIRRLLNRIDAILHWYLAVWDMRAWRLFLLPPPQGEYISLTDPRHPEYKEPEE